MTAREMTAREMVGLSWTWIGPTLERDDQGNEWWELRVGELPDFFVAATSAEEARMEAAPALEAFLQSYLNAGDRPRLPGGGDERPRVRKLAIA
jgi:hypothetical protein